MTVAGQAPHFASVKRLCALLVLLLGVHPAANLSLPLRSDSGIRLQGATLPTTLPAVLAAHSSKPESAYPAPLASLIAATSATLSQHSVVIPFQSTRKSGQPAPRHGGRSPPAALS